MVRVMGNSVERIRINDLNDVIYYRQKKEFTDQEYASSKDLLREIRTGRIIVLEKAVQSRIEQAQDSGISKDDINMAVRDALLKLPKNEAVNSEDLKKIIKDVLSNNQSDNIKIELMSFLPVIMDSIKQELSKLSVQGVLRTDNSITSSSFIGPEYVPDVSTEGMISNIQTESRESSGADVNAAMAALKLLNGIK